MSNKKDKQVSEYQGIEGRLDALLSILIGILDEIVKDKKANNIKKLKEKAATSLVASGIRQTETAKLLGIDVLRVNRACKGKGKSK